MKRVKVAASKEQIMGGSTSRKNVYTKIRDLLNAVDELSGAEFEEFESYAGSGFYQSLLDANQDLYPWSQR